MNFARSLLIAAALIATGSAALAQATIDQNKALAGSLPGDSAGFPVTITQPGSYKLMSNLVVPAGVTGIEIKAKNVTLDLNGFSVTGPISCTRNDTTRFVTCAGATGGQHTGIGVEGDAATIRNGTVSGFPVGITAGYLNSGTAGGAVLENLLVTQNGYGVIGSSARGPHVHLKGVVATLNSQAGITMLFGLIERSQSNNNGDRGFALNMPVSLIDSLAYGNNAAGVHGGVLRGVNLQGNGVNRSNVLSMGGNMDSATVF